MENQQRRHRGEGSISSREPRSPPADQVHTTSGKPVRESTRTGDSAKAARFLRQRLAEIESNPV